MSRLPTSSRVAKGTAVQVSFDSSDPLADVLSVVGTVYGVKLTVTGEVPEAAAPNSTAPAGTVATTGGQRAKASPRKSPRSTTKKEALPADSTSAARDAGLAQRVRAWARDNKVEVSDRGRLPQSTVDAYTAAQS